MLASGEKAPVLCTVAVLGEKKNNSLWSPPSSGLCFTLQSIGEHLDVVLLTQMFLYKVWREDFIEISAIAMGCVCVCGLVLDLTPNEAWLGPSASPPESPPPFFPHASVVISPDLLTTRFRWRDSSWQVGEERQLPPSGQPQLKSSSQSEVGLRSRRARP